MSTSEQHCPSDHPNPVPWNKVTGRRLVLQHPTGLDESQRQVLEQSIRDAATAQDKLARRCDLIRGVEGVCVDAEGFWLNEANPEAVSFESLLTGTPLEASAVARHGVELCEALLQACYSASEPPRPHGALRPQCIFVDDRRIQISDCGLAEAVSSVIGPGAAREELDLLAPYIARELWLSPGAYGELRDLFAIGVILYEQATSHHPFGANRNDYDDCEQRIVMRQNVPAVEAGPHLEPAFAEILDRAVARREGDRFESLRALRNALKPFAIPGESAATRPPVDTRTLAASIADQQVALERLCEPLRAGLYPDARVVTRIANTLPTLTATIHCFEVEDGAVCIEIPLVWDGVNGSWKEQEPGALRDACIERAEAEIEARLHRAVIEASRVFGSHAQLLQLEFDPPQSEGDFPHTLLRAAVLLFKPPGRGEVQALGRIEAQFPFKLSPRLVGQARQAEKTFEQIVRRRQQHCAKEALGQLTRALPHAKVSSIPKRLKSFSQQIEFTLEANDSHESLHLHWSSEQWAFVPEPDWSTKLQRFGDRRIVNPNSSLPLRSRIREYWPAVLSGKHGAWAMYCVVLALAIAGVQTGGSVGTSDQPSPADPPKRSESGSDLGSESIEEDAHAQTEIEESTPDEPDDAVRSGQRQERDPISKKPDHEQPESIPPAESRPTDAITHQQEETEEPTHGEGDDSSWSRQPQAQTPTQNEQEQEQTENTLEAERQPTDESKHEPEKTDELTHGGVGDNSRSREPQPKTASTKAPGAGQQEDASTPEGQAPDNNVDTEEKKLDVPLRQIPPDDIKWQMRMEMRNRLRDQTSSARAARDTENLSQGRRLHGRGSPRGRRWSGPPRPERRRQP